MRSLGTATFCKLRTCPSSEVLLLYHDATLTRQVESVVAEHLSACDFCGAEMHLLSKFPPAGSPLCQSVRMPWHLYRLAKDILLASVNGVAHSVESIYEPSSLTLT